MNKKIATLCMIVSLLFIGNNLGAEVITNHMMTKDPKSGTGCETPTPNFTFSTEDEVAYCWVDIDDMIEGDLVEFKWYSNSVSYADSTNSISVPGNGCVISWIDIPSNRPGDWDVDFYYNGKFQFTEYFTIEGLTTPPSGPCPMSLIYGTDSYEVELLRSLRDNILSKSQEGQELIKLYYQWSPVIVRAMEADEEFKQEVKEMVDEVLGVVE